MRVTMMTGKVFVSYDHESDMLEVLWALRQGYRRRSHPQAPGRRRRGHGIPHPRDELAQGAEPS